MPTVETVRGQVELSDLGPTLMHEHVFVLSAEHVQNYGNEWWDEETRVTDAIGKLNALHAKGIATIVDPTVWGPAARTTPSGRLPRRTGTTSTSATTCSRRSTRPG